MQSELISFYNREEECLLRGSNGMFKYNRVNVLRTSKSSVMRSGFCAVVPYACGCSYCSKVRADDLGHREITSSWCSILELFKWEM